MTAVTIYNDFGVPKIKYIISSALIISSLISIPSIIFALIYINPSLFKC